MCNDSSQGDAAVQPVAAAFGGAPATRLQKEPAVTRVNH